MSKHPKPSATELDDQAWAALRSAVGRLEKTWQRDGSADLALFVPPEDDSSRERVLVELIKVDQEYRWESRQNKRLEKYLEEWPELAATPELVAELLEAECLTQSAFRSTPSAEELETRFPGVLKQLDLSRIEAEVEGERETACRNAEVSRDSDKSEHGQGRTLRGSPKKAPLKPGDSFGRYEARELLGRGGMGLVYRAYDTTLDRDIALKIPHFDSDLESTVAEWFLNEARTAAKIRHPNVCPIHDVGQIDGTYYLAMALIEGQTLAAWMSKQAVEPLTACKLLRKVASALSRVHEAGIVHRDIKASNVMIDESGEPLLMDFGLADLTKDDGRSSKGEQFLGTPAYMSPEQVRGETADARSDIYGVGVLLYELLTGRPPFNAPLEELLVRIPHEEPPRPREIRPEVDPDLEAICLKAMAKNPADRFQSAAELAEVFQQYIVDRPLAERPPTTRRAWFWLAAVVASLAVLAGLVIYLQTGKVTVESDVPPRAATDDYPVTIWRLQETLTASDGAGGHRFGQSVSICGNWAISGAPNRNANTGAVYFYEREGEDWVERDAKFGDAEGNEFAVSVSISGNHAIVGAHHEADGNTGAAYIYERAGENWIEKTRLAASDGAANDGFGSGASISGDWAIVGAQAKNSGTGAAYIFHNDPAGGWTEVSFPRPVGLKPGDSFGHDVDIRGDYTIVGAPHAGNSAYGSAFVYRLSGTTWDLVATLTQSEPTANDFFGSSVAINNEYALVGAGHDRDDGPHAGAAYVFKKPTAGWADTTETVQLHHPAPGANRLFGGGVSLSDEYALVGSANSNSAFLFRLGDLIPGKALSPERLFASGSGHFGTSVDICQNYSIVGADLTNGNTGVAYVFHGVRRFAAGGVIAVDGLVAWYQLDGNGTDSSGNNHHGTVYGASGTQDRFGHANSAMLFDGMDDYIDVPDHPDLNPTDAITVTAWFRADSFKYGCYSWPAIIKSRKGYRFEIAQVYENAPCLGFGATINGVAASTPPPGMPGSPVPEDIWCFIAGVYDGSTISHYFGSQGQALIKQQRSTLGRIDASSSNLSIGRDPSNPASSDRHFHGAIDDVRIYNRALSEAEVRELYVASEL